MQDSKNDGSTPKETPGAVKGNLLTALNFLGSLTGYWGNFYDSEASKGLKPEERARLLEDYRASIGLDSGLPGGEGFDKYTGARLQSASQFSTVKAPDNTSIGDKLKATSPAAIAVNEAINKALALKNETVEARKAFSEDMADVNEYIAKATYHPQNLIDHLYGLKNAARQAIDAQQKQERKDLEELFKHTSPQGFVENLKTSLGCDNDDQVKKIKKDMLQALTTSQEKELKEFDKDMGEPITKLAAAAQKEMARVAFLAKLYSDEANVAFRNEINQKALANRGAGPGEGEIELSDVPTQALFKGISVSDLTTIQSRTGLPLKPNGDGTFSMQLPNRILHPLYYRSSQHNLHEDMLALPQAMRACGKESITMSVNHKNKEYAMELAREAYSACRESGFDEKKITIKVNGEKITLDKLFAECPSTKNAIELKAKKIATDLADADKKSAYRSSGEVKKGLEEIKAMRTGHDPEAVVDKPLPPTASA